MECEPQTKFYIKIILYIYMLCKRNYKFNRWSPPTHHHHHHRPELVYTTKTKNGSPISLPIWSSTKFWICSECTVSTVWLFRPLPWWTGRSVTSPGACAWPRPAPDCRRWPCCGHRELRHSTATERLWVSVSVGWVGLGLGEGFNWIVVCATHIFGLPTATEGGLLGDILDIDKVNDLALRHPDVGVASLGCWPALRVEGSVGSVS